MNLNKFFKTDRKVICNSVKKECGGCIHGIPHTVIKENNFPPCTDWSYCGFLDSGKRVKCIPVK